MIDYQLNGENFTLIKHRNGKLFAFETFKNPNYLMVEDEYEFICYPVLFNPQGVGVPQGIFSTKIRKRDFEIVNLITQS